MTIILTLLKWLGILILILLAVAVLLLILVLLVPIRYRASGIVDDPDTHSDFPVSVFKERTNASVEVSWMFGAFTFRLSLPEFEQMCVKVFGREIKLIKFFRKEATGQAQEEQKEQEGKEEAPLSERAEKAIESIGRYTDFIDHIYRILTGSCGRRATERLFNRLHNILLSILPSRWKIGGTVGLSDPCLNGRMTGLCSVLMPAFDDHLQLNTEWEDYRFDLCAEFAGSIRLGVPVKEAVPLIFDKDCRKLFKKLMKAKNRFTAKERDRSKSGNVTDSVTDGDTDTPSPHLHNQLKAIKKYRNSNR